MVEYGLLLARDIGTVPFLIPDFLGNFFGTSILVEGYSIPLPLLVAVGAILVVIVFKRQ